MEPSDLIGLFEKEFSEEAAGKVLRWAVPGLDDTLGRIRRPEAALGVITSPLGRLLIATIGKRIVLNHYLQSTSDLASAISRLRMKFDPVEDNAAVKPISEEIRAYFTGDAAALHYQVDLALAVSSCQLDVLHKVREIPRGGVISNQALGAAVGFPEGGTSDRQRTTCQSGTHLCSLPSSDFLRSISRRLRGRCFRPN